ncbi:SusC/RagA family TonB-linked outer membrane protein [Chitinophaga arvensicola]|uniref:TonB-linked outer membrane protein, SusC/RagA family n=1 Tax=Chitinophaga arvensicola TaxID=29529 RepID=A0A1I0S957_9BACT|nr:TonB-dependent receptor [Chitinophaga arvensicola]SEW52716.1 TonB-linked outer membrane protein, SusC/RagA family [Chitinophaga arvensicola]
MKIRLLWRLTSLSVSAMLIGQLPLYAYRGYPPPVVNIPGIVAPAEKVTGLVTDSQGQPVPGVTVAVRGTSTGTTTDEKGRFTIQVTPQQIIVFSYIGFQNQEIVYKGQPNLSVTLLASSTQLNEIVTVGYQTQRKVDLTGAVSVVSIDNLKNAPTANPIQSLQGQVPGLIITTSGDPSGAATVRIRGVNTLNNNDPLYIIDGVPTKSSAFQILNAEDIESIQVLKDASSAAIYGARSSNGVIIVTTKQANVSKTVFNFSSQLTHSKYVTAPPLLNTMERAKVQWQATINDGLNPDDIPFVKYDWGRNPDGTAVLRGITIPDELAPGVPSANTDWFDAITRPGLIQEYNLSLSSGSKNGGAFMSLGYLKDNYIERFKDFQKLSLRVNSHHQFLDGRIKIGENLTITNGINNGDATTTAFADALQLQPVLPVKLPNGEYSGPVNGSFVDHPNSLMTLDLNKWDQVNALNIFGNVYANVSILKNLKLNASLGVEHANTEIRDIQRKFATGFISRTVNSLKNSKSEEFNWNLNTTLQYSLDVNRHRATFLAGSEAVRNNYAINSTYKENFALETLDYFVENAGSGNQTVGGSAAGFSLLSYFGKVNYSYDSRYLFSATLRYDGSSRFGKNNRFGTFPAVSAGWRINEEHFIRDNTRIISDLKLRAGWGRTGNQEISNTARYGLFETYYGLGAMPFTSDNGTAYDIAGADSGPLASGFRQIQNGNDNLRWESTTEQNIGLDVGLFEQKLTASFDYFNRATKDILISPAYLAAQGEGGTQFVNGAAVKTKGFEIAVSYKDQVGAFNYAVTGNVGHYLDRITDLPENVVHSYPGNSEQTILGRSMNSIFGYVADGLFQNQKEVDNSADQPGKGIGRIRYADLNNDGVINTLDQRYLGVAAPLYSFGLNLQGEYKGFTLSIFFQGVAGISVYDERKRFSDFTDLWAGTNYGKRTLDAWTPENTTSTIPAVTLSDNNNEGRQSSYFIASGAYVKLREVSLGYLIKNIRHLNPVRVYVTGQNLLTMKGRSFTSPDPEDSGYGFPRPRKITFGFNLSF